jgi:hypothetical protein
MPAGRWLPGAALILLIAQLGGCAGQEPPADTDKAAPQATATTQGSDSTADNNATAPSPLLDQPKPTQATPGQSAADLPPIIASISTTSPNHIDVTVRDPLPVSRAVLVDQQGREIVASRIDHDRIAYRGGSIGWPTIGVGIMGGSNSSISTGFGIGFPLLPQTTQAAGSINESRFGFLIPDVASYDAHWQRWKIHVDLSDGVNSRSFETLPPAPPPG